MLSGKKCFMHSFFIIFCFLLLSATAAYADTPVTESADVGSVHFLTLNADNDAILLECNGKFGMVDSGEDSDYPNGSDSRYPVRSGTIVGQGQEARVISYLHSLGVNASNFEFYIGTHPHSDHIGSADEIIREFHPKRVYIEPYSDSYITNSGHLWDNLYVYDHMISAAKETGATLIQYFKEGAPIYPETVSISGTIIDPTYTDGSDWQQPASLSVVLSVRDNGSEIQTVTLSADSSSDSGSLTYSGGGQWHYEFHGISKYNDNKDAYTYTVTPEADGYEFSTVENSSYDFICTAPGNETTDTEAPDVEESEQNPTGTDIPDTDSSDEATSSDGTKTDPAVSADDSSADSADQDSSTSGENPSDTNTIDENTVSTEDVTADPTAAVVTQSTDSSASAISETAVQNAPAVDTQQLATPHVSVQDLSGLISLSSLGGVEDEEATPVTSYASDALTTSAIAEQDRVVADNDIDPANADEGKASASARSGIHEDSTGAVSTPTFYLGGTNGLKIEIRNYGVYQKVGPQPDANYFSLGVKVTSVKTGVTAFLSGDINNYIGAETTLANELGHVDLLKLGHHGAYGSNTNSYIAKLNPEIAVMTGKFTYMNNTTINNECGTFETLLQAAKRGTAFYATAWYSNDVPALVFQLDKNLSHPTIPSGKSMVAASSSVAAYYYNGYPTVTNGWHQGLDGGYYYFSNSYLPLASQFSYIGSSWYYFDASGRMQTGWVLYNGKYYYMDPSSGKMKTGWVKVNNIYYYLDSSGAMITGAHTIQGKEYYFANNGAMVASSWVGNKYYGADGAYVPNYRNNNWRQDSNGYWYRHPDGSYPKSKWELIDGTWYYFDNRGYMTTGWQKIGGKWYYMNQHGAMVTGWLHLGSTWYYLSGSGAMVTGWQKVGASWYYFAGNGAMYGQGWHWISNKCYYMKSSGSMAANTWIGNYYVDASGAWIPNKPRYTQGWVASNGRWWYRHANGSYTRSNWELINGKWYYFDASGWMKTGWVKVRGKWYYLSSSGAMVTGWQTINGKRYYLNASGAMLTGWQKLNNQWYYFDTSGAMLGKGWHLINNKYYYMDDSGVMAANTWIGPYYVNASGAWVK